LVNAEAGTISWFAIQEGPSRFAIFDTFDDEAGRDAHLNGKVAAASMGKAKTGDLFAKAPEIHRGPKRKLRVLASRHPFARKSVISCTLWLPGTLRHMANHFVDSREECSQQRRVVGLVISEDQIDGWRLAC
jgi:hypothetical protein